MNRLLTIFCITVMFGCGENKNERTTTALADSVEVFTLKKDSVVKRLTLPAELYAWERAEIFAKVQGYVKELRVDLGDRVRRNDIMMIVDAPEVTANYAKANADLQAALSKYHTSLDHYKRILQASKEKGAVSESELERSRNQMLTDSANHEALRSSANAYAQLKNYLVVRAAFDGVITARSVDPGTLVGNSQPMLVLENLSRLRLRVAIPEAYTSALPETSTIHFSVDAQPSKKYTATLARKSNTIDEKTRTEMWEFEVPNGDKELKSGMYGSASFDLKRAGTSFVVPYSAVVTNLERNFVIRVRDGVTEWVEVKNGIAMNDKVEIFADLHEGDLLIAKANDEIRNGSGVVVKRKG